jgi:hypothetical protein
MYASNYLKEGPMSHRRFEQILRNLHTVDTAALSETELAVKKNENPFFQVEEFLNALAGRFQSLYDLGLSSITVLTFTCSRFTTMRFSYSFYCEPRTIRN